jgi:hypothetical protein
MTELLTSREIHRLLNQGYCAQFTGKKIIEFEGSRFVEQYYEVEVSGDESTNERKQP